MNSPLEPAIGVIGGSGLYSMAGLSDVREVAVSTAFGPPSDIIVGGRLADRLVFFLPRHGKGHRILPSEINHRANILALRQIGVRWIISVSAVGSLKEEYAPRHVLVPDQIFDRTSRRERHTFFGDGIVAHISFADPYSTELRKILLEETRNAGGICHDGGVYVNMDGPAFSTRAESLTYRKLGFDVIGMTNAPEAKLAREAEISFATMAMVTDYDCWKEGEEAVGVESVVATMHANSALAPSVIERVVPRIPLKPNWPEHRALETSIMTPRDLWPEEKIAALAPLLARFQAERTE